MPVVLGDSRHALQALLPGLPVQRTFTSIVSFNPLNSLDHTHFIDHKYEASKDESHSVGHPHKVDHLGLQVLEQPLAPPPHAFLLSGQETLAEMWGYVGILGM